MDLPGHLSAKNLFNAFLMVAVGIPPVLFVRWWNDTCTAAALNDLPQGADVGLWDVLGDSQRWQDQDLWCKYSLLHPVGFLNVLFFVFVCLLFWLINLFQRSTWLIDPYWTIAPVMINHYFMYHPLANETLTLRSLLCTVLLWLWSLRLTHSYFRREEWRFGVREDWRFADMRQRHGALVWGFLSLWVAFVSQQPMLVGICLPLYAVHHGNGEAWGLSWGEGLCAAGCVAGLWIAYVADTQLREFMLANERRAARGEPKELLLDRGLWRYSRHPNYFGEQLWWWSLAGFGVLLGQPWVVAGTFLNSVVLAVVTVMTERRILRVEARRKLYGEYQSRTSVWIPLPKFGRPSSAVKQE
ncbi:3-oxo-5-alpha-steroid dehydrogenase [Balamuthia mandrillaris]